MELKTMFKVSAVAVALVLAGCGGDINVTPTVNDNSTVNNPPPTDGGDNGGDDNPCASYGSKTGAYDGQDCAYSASFASKLVEITEDLTFKELPNGGVHVFDGMLKIGKHCDTTTGCSIEANGPVMTVEPGAHLAFTSGESLINIARGAKINAVGTLDKPIVFTSANAYPRLDVVGLGPQFADWGGIIINGRGLTNTCTNAQRDANTCNAQLEGIENTYYGGNNFSDSSGTIQYAKIWYSGSGPRQGQEGADLNSLTLAGVGSGSSFDYIHIHQGYDDGIELFGGAATIKHIVITNTQDDSIDADEGWQGKGQFLLAKHGTVQTKKEVALDDGSVIPAGSDVFMGNGGFEMDGIKNGGPDYDQAPPSKPTLANVTVLTTDGKSVRDNANSVGMKFDDFLQGNFYNFLLVKTESSANTSACLEFKKNDDTSVSNLKFHNAVMACANDFVKPADVLGNGQGKDVWFAADGANQSIGGNADVLAANGYATNTASADISISANNLSALNDSFFTQVDFIGALSDQDTTSEWYKWVQAAISASEQD